MVTSPHYLATQAGLDILRRGGTAADAAIAAAATLTVIYPQMCTLGGDNFWLIYNHKTGEVRGLNASGRAGTNATIEFYASRGLKSIPSRGYLAANTVPGTVSGWEEAYRFSREEPRNRYSLVRTVPIPHRICQKRFSRIHVTRVLEQSGYRPHRQKIP